MRTIFVKYHFPSVALAWRCFSVFCASNDAIQRHEELADFICPYPVMHFVYAMSFCGRLRSYLKYTLNAHFKRGVQTDIKLLKQANQRYGTVSGFRYGESNAYLLESTHSFWNTVIGISRTDTRLHDSKPRQPNRRRDFFLFQRQKCSHIVLTARKLGGGQHSQ